MCREQVDCQHVRPTVRRVVGRPGSWLRARRNSGAARRAMCPCEGGTAESKHVGGFAMITPPASRSSTTCAPGERPVVELRAGQRVRSHCGVRVEGAQSSATPPVLEQENRRPFVARSLCIGEREPATASRQLPLYQREETGACFYSRHVREKEHSPLSLLALYRKPENQSCDWSRGRHYPFFRFTTH